MSSGRGRLIGMIVNDYVVPRSITLLGGTKGIPSEIWSTLPLGLKTRLKRFDEEDYSPDAAELRALQTGIIANKTLANLLIETDQAANTKAEADSEETADKLVEKVTEKVIESIGKTEEERIEDAKETIAQPFTESVKGVFSDIVDTLEDTFGIDEQTPEGVPVAPIQKVAEAKYQEEHWANLYKKTRDPKYKDKAVVELKPIINKFVNKSNQSKSISHGALFNKGLVYVSKAIDKWDPKQAKLTTHVTHGLKKLYRDINKYGPMLHIPEHRIGNWGVIAEAIEEYEHEYGSSSYDPKIIAEIAGVSVSDVVKALPENNRKVYDDSSTLTNSIPYPTKYINVDFDQLAKEFEYSPSSKRIFKIMVKFLKDKDRDLANITTTEVEREYNRINKVNQLSYTAVHKEVKKIVAKIKDAYSYG